MYMSNWNRDSTGYGVETDGYLKF